MDKIILNQRVMKLKVITNILLKTIKLILRMGKLL